MTRALAGRQAPANMTDHKEKQRTNASETKEPHRGTAGQQAWVMSGGHTQRAGWRMLFRLIKTLVLHPAWIYKISAAI